MTVSCNLMMYHIFGFSLAWYADWMKHACFVKLAHTRGTLILFPIHIAAGTLVLGKCKQVIIKAACLVLIGGFDMNIITMLTNMST